MGYIKKADYIAKYGEEAWIAHTAKQRQWKEEHPDYNKRWREEHPDYDKQYSKRYYEENTEKKKEYSRQYDKEHAEERKKYRKQYHKQYLSTQLGRAKSLKSKYIQTDKEKGFPTDKNIDEDWIIENIFNSSCVYCGDSNWEHLGADRIDNTKGHTPDNCVCSCWDCNNDRNDKFTVEEFIQYRKLHPREQPIPDADDKVIGAWKGRFKISSKSINF